MDNRIELDTTQFIVINLGAEQFGINIQFIDNIVRMPNITRVPNVQSYFKGVINLRGEIVPVMSLRLKMNLEDDEITDKSRIIILKPEQGANIGVIVDEVKEVVTLESSDIEKVSYSSKDDKTYFINGIGQHKSGLISLLDLNAVIEDRESY